MWNNPYKWELLPQKFSGLYLVFSWFVSCFSSKLYREKGHRVSHFLGTTKVLPVGRSQPYRSAGTWHLESRLFTRHLCGGRGAFPGGRKLFIGTWVHIGQPRIPKKDHECFVLTNRWYTGDIEMNAYYISYQLSPSKSKTLNYHESNKSCKKGTSCETCFFQPPPFGSTLLEWYRPINFPSCELCRFSCSNNSSEK